MGFKNRRRFSFFFFFSSKFQTRNSLRAMGIFHATVKVYHAFFVVGWVIFAPSELFRNSV